MECVGVVRDVGEWVGDVSVMLKCVCTVHECLSVVVYYSSSSRLLHR